MMSPLALHKALPVFVLPLGFSLLCLAAALRWRRRALVAVPFVLLIVLSLPVISDRVLSSLENRYASVSTDRCPAADAVFPLGGILAPRPTPAAPVEMGEAGARFERALQLYFAGRAHTLVLSAAGQTPPGVVSEGEALRAIAIARGVPAEAIVVTPEAGNTAAEARALRDLAAARGWRRVLLVTSAFHMPRAMLLSRKCPAEVFPVPVDFEGVLVPGPFDPSRYMPDAESLFHSERALREYWGMLFYSVIRR